jgi:ubiquitin-like 1-activating enzyme E1 B
MTMDATSADQAQTAAAAADATLAQQSQTQQQKQQQQPQQPAASSESAPQRRPPTVTRDRHNQQSLGASLNTSAKQVRLLCTEPDPPLRLSHIDVRRGVTFGSSA